MEVRRLHEQVAGPLVVFIGIHAIGSIPFSYELCRKGTDGPISTGDLMLNVNNIFFALIPSLIGMYLVARSDRNREPLSSIAYAFALGVVFCLPLTLLFVGPFYIPYDSFSNPFAASFIHSSLPYLYQRSFLNIPYIAIDL